MTLFRLDPLDGETDASVVTVFNKLSEADADGDRVAKLMRRTLDQLYDGQRTGRYSWAQLSKTERAHFGTLFEINLRVEFDDVFDDGVKLDYQVGGLDVDCKFSQRFGGWMIPPEAVDEILVLGHVNDEASEYSFGVVRSSPDILNGGSNRDAKVTIKAKHLDHVRWLQRPGDLPPNVLLQLDNETLDSIFNLKSGQKRVNQLLRLVQRQRIGRGVIATVARQDDFMKRVRANGGARTALRPEGIVILGGDYADHRMVASQLGIVVPEPGEVVSVQLAHAADDEPSVPIDGRLWRVAVPTDPVVEAPIVPHTRKKSETAS